MYDTKKLETFSYEPHPCNYVNMKALAKQPTSTLPPAMGFNSVVIKPETRVNKAEDVGQHLQESLCRETEPEQPNIKCEHNWLDRGFIAEKCSKCGAINATQDTVINFSKPPEQTNLKIIEEIKGLISQVNDKLYVLMPNDLTIYTKEVGEKRILVAQAAEEIDLF